MMYKRGAVQPPVCFYTPSPSYRTFTLYLIGFGVIVGLLTSYINYQSNFTDIDNKLQKMASAEAEFKRELFFNYISKVEMLLSSIARNELTLKYIKSGGVDDKHNLHNLFYALSYANQDIMQLRYNSSHRVSSSFMGNQHHTLTRELARFDRYKSNFSVILFDIDFFKKVNDTYGHNTGDDVLVCLKF